MFVLRYIPSAELEALLILLKDSPDFNLASLILATINKLVRHVMPVYGSVPITSRD